MFYHGLRKRRGMLFAAALAVVLVGSSLYGVSADASGIPSPNAASIAAIQQSWSHVPEFTAAPQIEAGRVVDHSGHPVAGATVILFPFLFGPPKGTVIPAVSRAETDSAGKYTLHLPAARRSELANKWSGGSGGALNLHIMVFYPGSVADWFVPVPAGRTTAHSAKMALTAASAKDEASAPDTAGIPGNCSAETSPKNIGPVNEIIGYKSVLDSKVTTSFEWDAGFSETAGVGVSASGSYGGISENGSATITHTSKETFITINGATNNDYIGVSYWYWQEFACVQAGKGNPIINRWYLYQWYLNGANGTPGAPKVAAGHCVTSKGLTSYEADNETQQTWSQGAQLGTAGIGINLSSQDGYSTSAELTYHFPKGDYPPICGVHNLPGAGNGPDYIQIH